MAELSESERQALYDADVDIINSIADNNKIVLQSRFDARDKKTQAMVDKKIAAKKALLEKRKAGIRAEWDRRLAAVKPGQEYKVEQINEQYDGLSDLADLEYENWFDHAAEEQYKIDGDVKGRFDLEMENVEKWRQRELGSELRQLQRKTQRQRRR
jgi:hypothetical protein